MPEGAAPDGFGAGCSPYARRPRTACRVRGRRPDRRALLVGAAALLALLAVGAAVLLVPSCPVAPVAGPGATAGAVTSTPVSQWRAGTMPLLFQTDPAWADEPYAGATVAESGCGPTCLTMVYVYLTGKTDYDPASMCAFSDANGFVENDLTAWRLMTDGARMLGLTGEELPADASALANALAAGTPVICSMRPGDFTKSGHFIALCGLDENGRAVVFDPNSAERSAKTWDLQTILDQCANLWAFSVA